MSTYLAVASDDELYSWMDELNQVRTHTSPWATGEYNADAARGTGARPRGYLTAGQQRDGPNRL